jgi:pimeloyl-ACP methyl ester carboxylesterase
VLGRGPVELVLTPGWISNVDAAWDVPPLRSFFRQLASISRLILFDRRGSGLSDRPTQVESLALEHGVDDLRAVMDAAESERAVLFGMEDGGMLAGMFAASHPDRTVGLVLFAPWAKALKTPDYPFGWSEAEQEEWERHLGTEWGTTAFTRWQVTWMAPGLEGDEPLIQAFTRYWRACASPAAVKAIDAMQLEVDARPVLRSIHVPTLVMNRIDDRFERVDQARLIAGAIPGARLVELPGVEHPPFLGDTDRVLEELQRFITSIRTEKLRSSACSRRSCSRTSSDRPIVRRRSVTVPGAKCWSGTTNSCAQCSPAIAVRRSILPATGSSLRSTGQPAPRSAPRRSSRG